MQKEAELTIVKEVEEKSTLYVLHEKLEEKAKPKKFSKEEWNRLFHGPPLKTRTVTVRCDREKGLWIELDQEGNPVREFSAGVIMNARFNSQYGGEEIYLGCGIYEKGHVGTATGELLPVDRPISVPNAHVGELSFSVETGKFVCGNKILEAADYLILKEGCSSEIINAKGK